MGLLPWWWFCGRVMRWRTALLLGAAHLGANTSLASRLIQYGSPTTGTGSALAVVEPTPCACVRVAVCRRPPLPSLPPAQQAPFNTLQHTPQERVDQLLLRSSSTDDQQLAPAVDGGETEAPAWHEVARAVRMGPANIEQIPLISRP